MPAQDGVVYDARSEALAAPTGDIHLAYCRGCGYIGNRAYDASKVGFANYNYSQRHSEMFRNYLNDLTAELFQRHELADKKLVDIGCGEGYFLNLLCEQGENTGVGIDPSFSSADRSAIDNQRVSFIQDYYSEDYAEVKGHFVSCRHVIDELENPRQFVNLLQSALLPGTNPILYLELPNARKTFEDLLIWNIGYAKRSWFTAQSLTALVEICGMQVSHVGTQFNNEYLGIACQRRSIPDQDGLTQSAPSEDMSALLTRFVDDFDNQASTWERKIQRFRDKGNAIAVWGAGMRGINFLNRFGDREVFTHIVDINRDRQGHYLPASGYRIDAPEILKDSRPDRIVITNPNYAAEIQSQLAAMDVRAEIETL
jgi:SAM-dependent methyltransferase